MISEFGAIYLQWVIVGIAGVVIIAGILLLFVWHEKVDPYDYGVFFEDFRNKYFISGIAVLIVGLAVALPVACMEKTEIYKESDYELNKLALRLVEQGYYPESRERSNISEKQYEYHKFGKYEYWYLNTPPADGKARFADCRKDA